jgi:prolyl oligopeptidase
MLMSKIPFAPVEEVLHGVPVLDPYRWLEDRSLPETENWIREQQKRCDEYFGRIPEFGRLRDYVREYLDVEAVDQPCHVKDLYFYRKRTKGQEQSAIYVRNGGAGAERLLLDPGQNGPFVSFHIYRISADASLLAYEVKYGGEDRKAIHIFDVQTGRHLKDKLGVGYARGFVFAPKNKGYYYCHETGENAVRHEIRLHRFGQSSTQDQVIFHAARTPGSRLIVTADKAHLGAIWIHQDGEARVVDFSIAPIAEELVWKNIFSNKKPPYAPILCHGNILVLAESASGDSNTVLELAKDGEEFHELICTPGPPIRQLVITRNNIYAAYLENRVPIIHAWNFSGQKLGTIRIPSDGTIQLLSNPFPDEDAFFYSYESFCQPLTFYEYTCSTDRSAIWSSQVATSTKRTAYVQNLSYSSTDGIDISLTLVSTKDSRRNVPSPVIMTSYGGFGVPTTPQFSVLVTIMMKLGAIFALPHIRGGGEFGRSWHDAGRARNRQNAFNDFIAAVEWACGQGLTTPKKLAIFGGSNAGLLVGAAMMQRPELFGAVLCIAPLLDMVRYESFDQALRWKREYGTVSDADDFRILHAYSPYHHVEDSVNYPPVMFVSGDKDDRCNPAHVRKTAARLADRGAQTSDVVVDYSEHRGHSPVLPLSTRVDALTRRIAFLCKELDISITI